MTVSDRMNGLFMAGEISFQDSSGRKGSFHNDTMHDHIPAAVRVIGGDMSGSIAKMGIGTSVAKPGDRTLGKMDSVTNPKEQARIVDVNDDPNFIEEVTVNGKLYPNVAGVTFSAEFGEQTQKINNQEISEIALITQAGDLFARRIIPQDERIPRERGIHITYDWTIFYGVDNPEG